MKNTISFIPFILVFSLHFGAQAQSQGPVRLNPQEKVARPHLEALAQEQVHGSQPLNPYTFFQVEGAQVGFFANVARFITQASDGAPLAHEAGIEGCREHQAALAMFAQSIRQCTDLSASTDRLYAVLKQSLRACERVRHAEKFGEDFEPGKVSRSTQTELSGLLGVSSRIYLDLPWPATVWGQAEMATWRQIIAKVRASELVTDLNTSAREIASFQSSLRTVSATSICTQKLDNQLNALKGELANNLDYIAAINRTGILKAQAEAKAVRAKGLYRPTLPFPSLTDQERRFLGFWIGALNWRNRGGGPIKLGGTQAARLNFASRPFQELGRMAGDRFGEQVGGSFFLPLVLEGWGKWMDMGLSGGDPYEDLVNMTDRGLYQVSHALGNLKPWGYDTETLRGAGMQMGACYWYASRQLHNVRLYENPPAPYVGFVDNFTAWGELCTGGALGFALVDTLLRGSTQSAPNF